MHLAARIAWLVTGLVMAAYSLVRMAHPQYWNPVTTVDFLAVWSFSVGLILLGLSIGFIGRLAGTRNIRMVAAIVAVGAIMAGIANGIEDGLGLKAWGSVFVLGSLTAWFGLLVLAAALFGDGMRRLAAVVAGAFFILPLSASENLLAIGGAVLTIGTFGALAINPDWFTVRQTPLVPTPAPDGPAG